MKRAKTKGWFIMVYFDSEHDAKELLTDAKEIYADTDRVHLIQARGDATSSMLGLNLPLADELDSAYSQVNELEEQLLEERAKKRAVVDAQAAIDAVRGIMRRNMATLLTAIRGSVEPVKLEALHFALRDVATRYYARFDSVPSDCRPFVNYWEADRLRKVGE